MVEPWRKGYAESQRPWVEETMHYVTEFKPNYYDLAILHIDQQCLWNPENGDMMSKGRLFVEVNDMINKLDPDLPVVVINHMTPFHDKYDDTAYVVREIKKMLGDRLMICNSHKAREQWGWGETIIHGMEVDEWWDLPKEPRCVIVLSGAGMEKAYRRIFATATCKFLEDYGVPIIWVGVNHKAFPTFEEYRDFLGRSLVFFMPTWQSPMPRARTEAMLSGACIVTTPYHGADGFINSGRLTDEGLEYTENTNGFLTSEAKEKDPRMMDNPRYTADLIRNLIEENPDVAQKIGQKGKETARKLFNKGNFERQWIDYLTRHGIL